MATSRNMSRHWRRTTSWHRGSEHVVMKKLKELVFLIQLHIAACYCFLDFLIHYTNCRWWHSGPWGMVKQLVVMTKMPYITWIKLCRQHMTVHLNWQTFVVIILHLLQKFCTTKIWCHTVHSQNQWHLLSVLKPSEQKCYTKTL